MSDLEYIWEYKDGFIKVKRWKKYNFVDEGGVLLSKYRFDEVEDFKEWYAKVKKDGMWNLIDRWWKIVFKNWYDEIGEFDNWYVRVKKWGKRYLINMDWYDPNWYDVNWYDRRWFDRNWIHRDTWTPYDPDWYDVNWYDKDWYDRDWYDKNWYDRDWYDRDWYDRRWFNRNWIHRDTWTKYDPNWYDVDWYDRRWFDRNWIHRDTWTPYDSDWYDVNWYDKDWYTKIDNEVYKNFKNRNFSYVLKKLNYLSSKWINRILNETFFLFAKKEIDSKVIKSILKEISLYKFKQFLENQWIDISRLDNEKLQVIKDFSKYKLVKARAGTWKTTLLTYYIQFLVKVLWVNEDEILAFSFNRSAAKQLMKRVQNSWIDNFISSLTFHAFAVRVINSVLGHKYDILFDEDRNDPKSMLLSQFVQKLIENLFIKDEYLLQIYDIIKENFDFWDFLSNDLKEEYKDIRNSNYDTLEWITVDNKLEKWIMDFFFEYGLEKWSDYFYNRVVWNIPNTNFKKKLRANFLLNWIIVKKADDDFLLWEQNINKQKNGKLAIFIDVDNNYKDTISYFKRVKRYDEFIIINSKEFRDRENFENWFKEELKKYWLYLEKLSEHQILLKFKTKRDFIIEKFTKMIVSFISKLKQNEETIESLKKKLEQLSYKFWEKRIKKIDLFLELAWTIYDEYERRKKKENKKDFYDILSEAIKIIDKKNWEVYFTITDGYKKRKVYLKKIRYLLIDEYQDFNLLFHKLVNIIRKYNPDVSILAVWDDWQLINSFMWSNIKFINNFRNFYKWAKEFYLQTTYRLPERIVDLSNSIMSWRWPWAEYYYKNPKWEIIWIDFMQNVFEYKKWFIIDDENALKLIRIFFENFDENIVLEKKYNQEKKGYKVLVSYRYYDKDTGQYRERTINLEDYFNVLYPLWHLAKIVRNEGDNKKIFVITRTNEFENISINLLKQILVEYVHLIYWFKRNKLEKQINFLTAHSVKWLEAEVVILLDPVRFPLLHKDNFIELLFDRTVEDLLEEERRLFYVAVTRTLDKLYYFYDGYSNIEDIYSYFRFLKQYNTLDEWEEEYFSSKEYFDEEELIF